MLRSHDSSSCQRVTSSFLPLLISTSDTKPDQNPIFSWWWRVYHQKYMKIHNIRIFGEIHPSSISSYRYLANSCFNVWVTPLCTKIPLTSYQTKFQTFSRERYLKRSISLSFHSVHHHFYSVCFQRSADPWWYDTRDRCVVCCPCTE